MSIRTGINRFGNAALPVMALTMVFTGLSFSEWEFRRLDNDPSALTFMMISNLKVSGIAPALILYGGSGALFLAVFFSPEKSRQRVMIAGLILVAIFGICCYFAGVRFALSEDV